MVSVVLELARGASWKVLHSYHLNMLFFIVADEKLISDYRIGVDIYPRYAERILDYGVIF